jgi:hypothetical protein
METGAAGAAKHSASRIRLGVLMVLFSWTPVAAIIGVVLGWFGVTLTNDQTQNLHYICWSIQVPTGWFGVYLAGKETIDLAQAHGWRHVLPEMWHLLRSPGTPESNSPA